MIFKLFIKEEKEHKRMIDLKINLSKENIVAHSF
jgi:hypothetical protein